MNFKLALTLLISLAFIGAPPAFAKKDKPLPPGLQKKLERGGELPPGWQKKLAKGEILDQQVYDRGHIVTPVDKLGNVVLEVEDRMLRLNKATREIVDILK